MSINRSTGEITEVEGAVVDSSALLQLNKAEIDVQISTAHKFPRSVKSFIDEATELCTLNEEVAKECIYALPRKDADGQRKTIEGPSARFAEIIAHSFRNMRSGARVVGEDQTFITSQGFCHDLENNNFIAIEVQRRITTSSGKRYGTDMIGVTANAASSIALRNAVLKVIPKALWMPVYRRARETVRGTFETLNNRRGKALMEFVGFGVSKEQVLAKLDVKGIEDIGLDELVLLSGMLTALKDGDSTPEEMFADAAPRVQQPQARKPEPAQPGPAQPEPAQPESAAQAAEKQQGDLIDDQRAPDRTATASAPEAKEKPKQSKKKGDELPPAAGARGAPLATPNMIKQIELRIESYGADRNKLLGYIGVEKIDEMSVAQVNEALKWLEANA